MLTQLSLYYISFPLNITRYIFRLLGRGLITKFWDNYLYQSQKLKTTQDKKDLLRYMLTTKEGFDSLISASLDLTCLRILINDTYNSIIQEKLFNLLKMKKYNQLKYFLSGIILSGITHPLNVIKNNHLIQKNIINPKNGTHVFKNRKDMIYRLYQKEGFYDAFFSGLPLAMISIGLSNVIIMNLSKKLKKKNKKNSFMNIIIIPNIIFLINSIWNIPLENAKILMTIEPSKIRKEYNNSWECFLKLVLNKKKLFHAYKKWPIIYISSLNSSLYNYLCAKTFSKLENMKI